jgi:hypothetical protein
MTTRLGIAVVVLLVAGCGEVEVGGQPRSSEPTLEQVGKVCARMCWPRQIDHVYAGTSPSCECDDRAPLLPLDGGPP